MRSPLADKIRPQNIDDVVGQEHLLGENKPLRRIIESSYIPNMIFYGPPGVGKTTLASIIAKTANKKLHKLNGTTTSISDIKEIIGELDTLHTQNGILLYLDEIQYLNKKQQQTLLEFMENGKITLIASTTENPYFYIYKAVLSRSVVFEFKPIEENDIVKALNRAFTYLNQGLEKEVSIEPNVIPMLAKSCSGDVRKAINILELCFISQLENGKDRKITTEQAKDLGSFSSSRYDRSGDEYYDLLSAFQKSMRGSDPDAAIYYLARLLESGDLSSVCRRLMVCACEDVGLSYAQIMPIVKAAVDIALQVGLPEARIPLANAVIMVSNCPKSNSAYMAINKATEDIKNGHIYKFPRNLQNKHCDGDDVKNKGQHYLYPHDYENSWVKQQYLPDEIINAKYYIPSKNKNEQMFYEYQKKIKGK